MSIEVEVSFGGGVITIEIGESTARALAAAEAAEADAEDAEVAAAVATVISETLGRIELTADYSLAGTNALAGLTTGVGNTAYGVSAGIDLTSADNVTALGKSALFAATTGDDNVAVGADAGASITTGSSCTFVGKGAGYSGLQKVDALFSIAIGSNAVATKSFQAVFGTVDIQETMTFGDLRGGTAGESRVFNDRGDNTFLLAGAGPAADPGGAYAPTNCLAIGKNAFENVTAAGACVAIGGGSMRNAGGNDHTAVGIDTLQNAGAATVGCCAFGRNSLHDMSTGTNNSGFGDTTLRYTTTGDGSIAMGYGAGWKNVTGSYVCALGTYAGAYRQNSDHWIAIGDNALAYFEDEPGADTVKDVIAIGRYAAYALLSPENIAIGAHALRWHAGATGRNVAVGHFAANDLADGTDNTMVGYKAGDHASQKVDAVNSTALGANAYTTADNQVSLGGDAVTETVLHGAVRTSGSLRTGSFTVATVPSAAARGAGAMIYVSDEAGGAVPAFSDAANWRRCTDRAVIS
jgi:hypothetical protein